MKLVSILMILFSLTAAFHPGPANSPAAPNACTISWSAVITVTDSNANNTGLIIGQAPEATNGFDVDCGEAPYPPYPPAGVFDAHLIMPSGTDLSKTDIRPEQFGVMQTWMVGFQQSTNGLPVTLSWNPALLPAGAFFLKDAVSNGLLVNINMKSQSSASINNGALNQLKIEGEVTTAALVSGFDVTARPGGMFVWWSSAQETEVAGYNIYRAGPDGQPVRVNASLLVAKSSGELVGNDYSSVDPTPAAGENATYWLEVVMMSGSQTTIGPVSATRYSNFVFLPYVK